MSQVCIGVIGVGQRIRNVVNRVLKCGNDRIAIAGICDPSDESIRKTKEQFGDDIKVFESHEDLVADPAVEWVFVGSYNCAHREHAIAAFAAGKHVFCEKPLATTIEDCVAMRDAWLSSGKQFIIGFTLRFSPHYRILKEMLEDDKIGKLISMEFNETLCPSHGGFIHRDWRRFTKYAGTHLLEKCCHDVDLVNWFVGSKAKRVASFGGLNYFKPENEGEIARLGTNENGQSAFGLMRPHLGGNPFTADKDIIDNQVAIIEFENNVRTTFHTNCSTAIPERRMYFCGTEGTIRTDVMNGSIEWQRVGFGEELQMIDSKNSGGHGGGDNILGGEIAACILEGAKGTTCLDDGMRSAITCFGIDQAMATGLVVDMGELWKKSGI